MKVVHESLDRIQVDAIEATYSVRRKVVEHRDDFIAPVLEFIYEELITTSGINEDDVKIAVKHFEDAWGIVMVIDKHLAEASPFYSLLVEQDIPHEKLPGWADISDFKRSFRTF